MKPSQLKIYLEKFATDANTDDEKRQFLEWLKTVPEEQVDAVLEQYYQLLQEKYPPAKTTDSALFGRVERALDAHDLFSAKPAIQAKTISIRRLSYRVAAACLFICLSVIAAYYAFTPSTSAPITVAHKRPAENSRGLPGTNKAVLTLSDNSVVVLDDAVKGQIARQGNTQIKKSANGQLEYDVLNEEPADMVFNTLTTPKGGQFKLTLPDGSKVWLNAASSIRYPTAFTGTDRKVYITGEAYFEVAHDGSKPFHVSVNGMNVEDIGTAFNINAYENEAAINTTLVEGEVKITGGDRTQHLFPGQQTLLDKKGTLSLIKNADVELATAWKNGFTKFKSADIESIMRQVERWYDIEVIYKGEIPARTFTGGVQRDAALAELLRILELSNIHFKTEGKRLVVIP